MKLSEFSNKYGSKMKHLETIFLRDVFYKDFGEEGLDLIEPEIEISRNDGTTRKWRIDFVINTKNQNTQSSVMVLTIMQLEWFPKKGLMIFKKNLMK
jgi:hypothetical protein